MKIYQKRYWEIESRQIERRIVEWNKNGGHQPCDGSFVRHYAKRYSAALTRTEKKQVAK